MHDWIRRRAAFLAGVHQVRASVTELFQRLILHSASLRIRKHAEEAIGWRDHLVGLGGGSRSAGVGLVNGLLGGEESGADDLGVDHLGTLGLREHEPDNGKRLDGVVPGNVVKDDAGEGLEEGEHAEDDPVGEPLDVILGLRALEGLEREVGGDEETEEVGQEASGTVSS